ncbi:hypothetical protein [Nocardia jiangxiensis]|uniref:hypothetical protein n=1 Tax=Nocardia jiangxiensis TaxID=282685 RepID=UPI000303923A|nr:hypothetical protein [Nocardia jiangxiensis]
MSDELNTKDLAEVQHAFEVYTWTREQIAGLKEQQDQARSVIEAYLGDAEVGTLNGKERVTWHYREERRFDLRRARELHPEMVEECTETRRHRYFVPVGDES